MRDSKSPLPITRVSAIEALRKVLNEQGLEEAFRDALVITEQGPLSDSSAEELLCSLLDHILDECIESGSLFTEELLPQQQVKYRIRITEQMNDSPKHPEDPDGEDDGCYEFTVPLPLQTSEEAIATYASRELWKHDWSPRSVMASIEIQEPSGWVEFWPPQSW